MAKEKWCVLYFYGTRRCLTANIGLKKWGLGCIQRKSICSYRGPDAPRKIHILYKSGIILCQAYWIFPTGFALIIKTYTHFY